MATMRPITRRLVKRPLKCLIVNRSLMRLLMMRPLMRLLAQGPTVHTLLSWQPQKLFLSNRHLPTDICHLRPRPHGNLEKTGNLVNVRVPVV